MPSKENGSTACAEGQSSLLRPCASAPLRSRRPRESVAGILRTPEIIVGTWLATRPAIDQLSEAEVRAALEWLDPLWDELFPAEQARIVRLLVERVDLSEDGVNSASKVFHAESQMAPTSSCAPPG
jgi:hypothetical protein